MVVGTLSMFFSVFTPKFLHPAREILLFALNVFDIGRPYRQYFRSNKSRIEETLS